MKYDRFTPPDYAIDEVNVPVVLYMGGQDWLGDPRDVAYLTSTLPNITARVDIDYYNHLDFTWGMDAHTMVYADIIKRMDAHTKWSKGDSI